MVHQENALSLKDITIMQIKLNETMIVEVEIGSFVYDELTDTWIRWDMLDPETQNHLEVLVKEIEQSATSIRAAAVNRVTTLMKPVLAS